MPSFGNRPVRLIGRPARVLCEECGFLWYGATAAHGLSIIGHCPRCGGSLSFRDHSGAPAEGASADPVVHMPRAAVHAEESRLDLEPAHVLGTPQSWAR